MSAALLSLILTSCSWGWQAEVLPKELRGAVLLSSSDTSGLREGCRSAVYRLSNEAVRGLAAKGIGFFEKTGGEPSYRWRETPGEIDYLRNGRDAKVTFYGLYAIGGCGDQSNEDLRSREIGEALQRSGSFYCRAAIVRSSLS